MKKVVFISLILVTFLASCKKDDTVRAKEYLKKAEQLFAQGNYNSAKLSLDSIHLLFPRLIPIRQAADTLMYKVELAEAKRNLIFADKMLPLHKHLADSLLRSFRYEKNAKYEDVGRYIYKTQSGTNRIGLRAYVTELGEMTIVSSYTGSPLGFSKTKVSVNDLFAETVAGSGDSRTAFTHQGQSWENVSYTDPEINGVDNFIAHNLTAKMVVALEGGKRSYSYVLSQAEKQAITQSYYLAEMLRNVVRLKKDIEKAKNKITIVCPHLRLNPQDQLPEKFR
ncbi:MAG: putative lipoprotein [Bacteroidetes bacterium]|nr:putative lipoprotein [Bacteroidota bacterium]